MYSRSTVISYLLGLLISLIALQTLSEPLLSRQAELEYMLRHDCGSCHGMTLKGGLGPALTPDALHNKSRAYIHQSIRFGHPGTPMPAWEGLLSLEDIDYLVELLMTQAKPS